MEDIVFTPGSVPVAVAARVYGKDATWIRAGLITGYLKIGTATRNGKVITVEEHNIHGGIAGIISEINAYKGLGLKITPIGIDDVFAKGYGNQSAVRKQNGLDANGIYNKMRKAISDE